MPIAPEANVANLVPSGSAQIGAQQTPPAPASYSGTFIPQIWSRRLLLRFYSATVLAAITNTDYQGEIGGYGDTVVIRQRPQITVQPYVPNAGLTYQRPNMPTTTFTIDYADAFAVAIDDVYAHQADIDMMNMWIEDATEQLKINVDKRILGTVMPGAAHANNKGANAGAVSGSINLGATGSPLQVVPASPSAGQTDVLDLITGIGEVLDEQNIPEEGRYLLLPHWMVKVVKMSPLRDVSLSGDGTTMLRNGRIGMIDRFEIYATNHLPTGTASGLAAGEFMIFAGHKLATTFAAQIQKVTRVTFEETMAEGLRGLAVYGAKVLQPEALVEAVVVKA